MLGSVLIIDREFGESGECGLAAQIPAGRMQPIITRPLDKVKEYAKRIPIREN